MGNLFYFDGLGLYTSPFERGLTEKKVSKCLVTFLWNSFCSKELQRGPYGLLCSELRAGCV